MLSKKRILITGGNGGIGASIAQKMLDNHADLVLLFHKNDNQIKNLIKNNPTSNIELHSIDLNDIKKLEKILKKIVESEIDIFIHSVTPPIENKEFIKLDWSEFENHFNVQTRSFALIVKSLIPEMKKNKRGKIISILSSYTVGKPPNKISPYLVSKYALLGLSKSLAVELGEYGITVNSISPSLTETELTRKLPNKLKEISINKNPLKRLATTEDIASAALFFCLKSSDFVTGENFLITGGENMN